MKDRDQALMLLALLRQDWRTAERICARAPLDPETFLALVRECDVHPWLHSRLEEAGRFDLVGPVVEQRLGGMRRKCRSDNLLLLARTEQGLDRLLEAGVVPVALKGLDLLHRLYTRFDERTLDDVDLLIRPGDLHRALDALERAGWGSLSKSRRDHFLRSSHHLPVPGPGPIVVDFELHWNLVQEQRFELDPRDLFDRAVPIEVAGRPVLRLEDHDLAAHLLLHHFTHYFDRRLKWSIDLQRIAGQPGFDWRIVAERISAWGARAAVGMSVLHLVKAFPRLIPPEAQRLLQVSAWRRWLTAPLRSRHPLDLFRGTRRRNVQLYLAAVMLENPRNLPSWLLHRIRRGGREELSPLTRERGQADRPRSPGDPD